MRTPTKAVRTDPRARKGAEPATAKIAALPSRNLGAWTYGWVAAAALIAVFTVYAPALDGPFLLDDSYLPYTQSQYATAPLLAWIKGIRPMLMLTYWMNYQISGSATGSYHFVNVGLHFLNGVLIFLSMRK